MVLRLRFEDFSRSTRSHTLAAASDDTAVVLAALRGLMHTNAALIRERGITLLGVTLSNLDNANAVQLELPFERRSLRNLDSAVDRVRERYGSSAITRGVLLGVDRGLTVPLLPD